MSNSGNNDNGGSVISQRILEQNEDILAAIVENLQIGRLDDCIQHYTILQNNLVQLATELDNYPFEELDAYDFLNIFPDEIMRKDVLESYLSMEEKNDFTSPLIPACDICAQNKISAHECRVKLKHIEPNHQLTNIEKTELIHATQVILARQKQTTGGKTKEKRTYKRWDFEEIYTLELALAIYGFNYSHIAEIFQDRPIHNRRTEAQIKNFIRKKSLNKIQLKSLDELLANPPAGYIPPTAFMKLFSRHHSDPYSQTSQPGISSNLPPSSSSSKLSNSEEEVLVERQKKSNFLSLVALASGYQLPEKSEGELSSPLTKNTEDDVKSMKEELVGLINNPSAALKSDGFTNFSLNTIPATPAIPPVSTLTNQFIFPPNSLFDETINPTTAAAIIPSTSLPPSTNSNQTLINSKLDQKLTKVTLKNSALLGLPTPIPTIPSIQSLPTMSSIATANQVVAATAAAEAAGLKIPPISTILHPSAMTTSLGESSSHLTEDQSVAILRLKASNTKSRTEQAKLLLEYYQNFGYQNVPPFARPGLDKLKQKHGQQVKSPIKSSKSTSALPTSSSSDPNFPQTNIPPQRLPNPPEKEKEKKSKSKSNKSSNDAEGGREKPSKTKESTSSNSLANPAPLNTLTSTVLSNYHQLREFDQNDMTVIPEFGHDFSFL